MKTGLKQRLEDTGVVCAEGYLFEMERRGYLTSGEFVPEVALENPDALKGLHKDFQHAGSDVVVAFTYNGHREKMRIIGKEDLLEPLNRAALQIANEVAADVPEGYEPNLVAGNISNSNIWNPEDPKSQQEVRKMFSEMVEWAVDEGVDYFIGETFYFAEEAFAALEVIQQSKKPAKAAPSPKETESGQRIRRNQTLDQIMRKAAIHLRNDQHEAIIDLKSDFLGHIRMQVICENQKVTVRFLVEHVLVKDMIERNLNQLKTDLQQQGLEVDKLEVTFSGDSDESGSSKEKLAQWRAGQGNADHRKNDEWKDRQQKDARHPSRTAINAATVDYFA